MSKDRCINLMLRTANPHEQIELRNHIRNDGDYYRIVLITFLNNPFFRLLDEEIEHLAAQLHPQSVRGLVLARDAASRSTTPKFAVFCMPKSGSSFISSALEHALQLPPVSLTGFGSPGMTSHFGMNSREQELDEGAIMRSILTSPEGFVAQAHTRYSQHLALQLNLFRIRPIVAVRNILDCMVSFDDMLRDWRRTTTDREPWFYDPPFALPVDYPDLDEPRRYEILSRSYGVWLISFYLSWKRCQTQGVISPLWIRYEDHVLDPPRLVDRIGSAFDLPDEARARLASYAGAPDPSRSRLNVGKAGRGAERVPRPVRTFLTDYARIFRGELSEEDIAHLVE